MTSTSPTRSPELARDTRDSQDACVQVYPGCLIPYRFPEYELSAHAILEKLGIAVDPGVAFTCCGSQLLESTDAFAGLALAARNLAMAQARAQASACRSLLTLCGSCTHALLDARRQLRDAEMRATVNELLEPEGLVYRDRTPFPFRVLHVVRFLTQPEVFIRLRALARPLEGPVSVSLQVPCMAARPPALHPHPSGPTTFVDAMGALVSLAGAEVVPYPYQDRCCGGTMLAFDEEVGKELGRLRYAALRESGADLLVTACPNCELVYAIYPPLVEGQPERDEGDLPPALFLTQLLGLALGLAPAELGLDRHPDAARLATLLAWDSDA